MTADAKHLPQIAGERRAWSHPELTRFRAGEAEFGGGPANDGDSGPS